MTKVSTDPRDLFFAFQGCLAPRCRDHIIVNYQLSALSTFIDALKATIAETKDLKYVIGGFPILPLTVAKKVDIPSWLPSEARLPRATLRYRACDGGSFGSPPDYRFQFNSKLFVVKGVKLGIVCNIAAPLCLAQNYEVIDETPDKGGDLNGLIVKHIHKAYKQLTESTTPGPILHKIFRSTYLAGAVTGHTETFIAAALSEDSIALVTEHATQNFYRHVRKLHLNRQIFTFSSAQLPGTRFGLGPIDSAPGDVVCVLFGCPLPILLRPLDKQYSLLGEVYVPGLMHGEAIKGDRLISTFEIW